MLDTRIQSTTTMRILFFGTPEFVLPVIKSIKKHFDLVGIVTTPDTKQGRKKVLTPSPVKQYAVENHLNAALLTPEKLTQETAAQLKDLSADLIIVAAYGKIIPQFILDIPTYGSVNIHPSLLPQYRGPSPIQTALLNGDTTSGVTFILMDQEIDHGPILAQEKMEIQPTDTFASLPVTMFAKAAEILPEVVKGFVKGIILPQEQDHSHATFCEHVTKESGYFDSNNPPSPDKLDRMIRAYYPWPTAWTKIRVRNGLRIMRLLPGHKVQLEGGKPMEIKDFLNGYPEMRETIQRLLL